MTTKVRYIGSETPYFPPIATGVRDTWRPGVAMDVTQQQATALLATGVFEIDQPGDQTSPVSPQWIVDVAGNPIAMRGPRGEVLGGAVDVRAFGAVGNGVADDTAAIQACADYLATIADQSIPNGLVNPRRPTMYFPAGAGYVITAPVTVAKNISVVMDAPIFVSAPAGAVETWLNIGQSAVANRQSRNVVYDIDIRRVTLSDWEDENDIGVRISAAASFLRIRRIDRFCVGAQLVAPYSLVELGEFRDCKFGLDISHDAIDFTNQMLVLGGEFANLSGLNAGKSRYGVRLTRGAFAFKGNSITFISPSFEMNVATAAPGVAVPFYVNDFLNVQAKSVRSEGCSPQIAELVGDSRWCQFDLIYGDEFSSPIAGLLVDNSTHKIGNRAWISGGEHDWRSSHLVFDSGNFVDAITNYNGSTYHIKNMEFLVNTAPPTFGFNSATLTPIYKTGEVNFGTSNPGGVRLRTSRAKTFCLVLDGPVSKDTSVTIVAFDADGNQLSTTGSVKTNQPTADVVPNLGVYGGAFTMSGQVAGNKSSTVIRFADNVDTAFIGIIRGPVRRMSIYAVDGNATYFSKSTAVGAGERLATAAPANGHYWRGAVVRSTVAGAGGTPGWVCVTTGQSGTLSGVTADATSGSRVVTVSSADNLWVGCAITIAGVTGTKFIEALEGTQAFVDTNCDATVSGAAVAYVAPAFRAMANLAA
jgi:hypothetical protein